MTREEALKALLDGKKIFHNDWMPCAFLKLNAIDQNLLEDDDGCTHDWKALWNGSIGEIYEDDWHVVNEDVTPKEKPKEDVPPMFNSRGGIPDMCAIAYNGTYAKGIHPNEVENLYKLLQRSEQIFRNLPAAERDKIYMDISEIRDLLKLAKHPAEYDIKITGSGTGYQLAQALRELAEHIELTIKQSPESLDGAEWEDPYLMTLINRS